MGGLIAIAAALTGLVIALIVAWWWAKRANSGWAKASLFVLATAALLVGPFVDEIVGGTQFKRYCVDAENINFSGTIPVGIELYTPDGQWRLAHFATADAQEHTKLVRLADSLVRWDHGTLAAVPAFVPMWQRQTRIYDAQTNRLVAEWVSYSYRGGWLSRIALGERLEECRPKLLGGSRMYQQLFSFKK